MATAISAVQQRKVDDAAAKDQAEFIPEIIEERRKDSEGRSVLTKYIRGKLLGKVVRASAKAFTGDLYRNLMIPLKYIRREASRSAFWGLTFHRIISTH